MRRLQSQALALAWEGWADATTSAAVRRVMMRQPLERLQGRRTAAGFKAWVCAADELRRRRRLAQRAEARMRVRMLSSTWNGWADEAAAPVVEDEKDEEDPSQVTETPHPIVGTISFYSRQFCFTHPPPVTLQCRCNDQLVTSLPPNHGRTSTCSSKRHGPTRSPSHSHPALVAAPLAQRHGGAGGSASRASPAPGAPAPSQLLGQRSFLVARGAAPER